MRNLIPYFIKEKLLNNEFSGSFNSSVMIIDISGFTNMTDVLMKKGKEGVEILTEIINTIFSPSINSVYCEGGFISSFTGDGFNAVYDMSVTSEEASFYAASEIMNIFKKLGKQKTKFGVFDLSVKIGISKGKSKWNIISSKEQNIYFFSGEAVDRAGYFENHAKAGEVIVDFAFIKSSLTFKNDIIKEGSTYKLLWENVKNKNCNNNLQSSNENILLDSNWVSEDITNASLSGEFRDIISCFISFRDVENINVIINRIINLTNDFGGYFNKIDYGDKGGIILILFGAPVTREKIFRRAADFSLSLGNFRDLEFRIGMTYGTAFCGFIGNERRAEYTALGACVNLSSRLATESYWNEINVDEKIFNEIKTIYEVIYSDSRKIKGLEKEVEIYNLKRKREKDIVIDIPENFRFIGREEEIKKITSYFLKFEKERSAGIINIFGNPGTGKSYLTRELRKRLSGDKFKWIEMKCDEIIQKPFIPVIYYLKRYFNQSESNSEYLNKVQFEEKMLDISYDLKKHNDYTEQFDNDLKNIKEIIGSLLDLEWENSMISQINPKLKHELTINALKNLIKSECIKKTVIIFIEDRHWIDRSTLDFIRLIVNDLKDLPPIILSECRYEDNGEVKLFDFEGIFEGRIDLKNFSKAETKALTNSLVADISSVRLKNDNQFIEMIWKKTDGNPLYIEQLIEYVIEKRKSDENYGVDSDLIDLPASINSLIIARIDRLNPALREIVKVASVLGREFLTEVLFKILNKLDYFCDYNNELKRGESEYIWIKEDDERYIFKHSLIRDVAYQMQLKSNIRKIHKLAAEIMEDLYCNLKSYYFDIAIHYEKAGEKEKTIEYLEKAADYAKDNYQNELTLKYYDKLKKYFFSKGNEKKLIEIIIEKGKILLLIGKWSQAEKIFIESFNISKKINDKESISQAYDSLATLYGLKGLYTKSLEYHKEALKLVSKLKIERKISLTLVHIGIIHSEQRNYKDAMECYERAYKISTKLKDKRAIAKITSNMGIIYKSERNYKKAIDCYKKSLVINQQINNQISTSYVLGNLGIAYNNLGEYRKALNCHKQSYKIKEKFGDKLGLAKNLINIGRVYKEMDEYDKAEENYDKSRKIFEELGNKKGLASVILNLGCISKDLGDFSKAEYYFNESLSIKEELKDKQGISELLLNMGDIYKIYKEYIKSEITYDKAIKIVKERKTGFCLCLYLFEKAELYYIQRKYSEAEILNKESEEIAGESLNKKVIFKNNLLKNKINFIKGLKDESISNLMKMLKNEKKPELIAEINFELYKMTNDENYKINSLELFEKLYKKVKKYNYKLVIDELNKEIL